MVHGDEAASPERQSGLWKMGPAGGKSWVLTGPQDSQLRDRLGRKETDRRAGLLVFAGPPRWGPPTVPLFTQQR